MRSSGQHPSDFTAFSLHPWDYQRVVAGRLMTHPSDHGSLGSLLDGDAFRSGHGAAADRRGMIGDGPCHSLGEIGVIAMKAQEREDCPEKVFNVKGLGLTRRQASASFFIANPSVDRSASRSARMRSIDEAEAHTPLDTILRPFFS